jgi:hypothetical protein
MQTNGLDDTWNTNAFYFRAKNWHYRLRTKHWRCGCVGESVTAGGRSCLWACWFLCEFYCWKKRKMCSHYRQHETSLQRCQPYPLRARLFTMMGSIFSPALGGLRQPAFISSPNARKPVAPPHPSSTLSLPTLLKIWGNDAAQAQSRDQRAAV